MCGLMTSDNLSDVIPVLMMTSDNLSDITSPHAICQTSRVHMQFVRHHESTCNLSDITSPHADPVSDKDGSMCIKSLQDLYSQQE